MKVIKKINNNCALCIDDKNRNFVAFGKGIGFKKPPYELDLRNVDNAYYELNNKYLSLIDYISPELLEIANEVVSIAISRKCNIANKNVVFTLADHINFAIKRQTEGIELKLPIVSDLKYLYPNEIEIGFETLNMIEDRLGISLPKEEANCIALHIINAEESNLSSKKERVDKKTINDITDIIQDNLDIKIDKNSYCYNRFINHLYYLFKRNDNEKINNMNNDLYSEITSKCNDVNNCIDKISEYFKFNLKKELNRDEKLYLMIHIIKLCGKDKN